MTDFERMYSECFIDVYKYAYSLCRNEKIAEDITQETFLKALRHIDSFKGTCKIQVWLCQIAKNTYFSWYEKGRKEREIQESSWEVESESFEAKLIRRETAFEVHKVLHKMEEPYKEIFSLRMFGELSFAEIGELFNKTESWARVTYHRAKLKLREELK